MWWHTLVIPAPRRYRQENSELQIILGYTIRPYHKKDKERADSIEPVCGCKHAD